VREQKTCTDFYHEHNDMGCHSLVIGKKIIGIYLDADYAIGKRANRAAKEILNPAGSVSPDTPIAFFVPTKEL
jgi:hypothetical protein